MTNTRAMFLFSLCCSFFCSNELLSSDKIMQKLSKETLMSGAMGFSKWGNENQPKSEFWENQHMLKMQIEKGKKFQHKIWAKNKLILGLTQQMQRNYSIGISEEQNELSTKQWNWIIVSLYHTFPFSHFSLLNWSSSYILVKLFHTIRNKEKKNL